VLANCVQQVLITQQNNVRVMLDVLLKCLIMFKINSRLTGPTNITLGLRH